MTDPRLDDVAQALATEIQKNTAELSRVAKALEGILGSLEHKAYVIQNSTNPPAGTTKVPGIELKLEWKPFKDKPGHWAFSKSNPLLRDTLLAAPNKALEHGGFKYRLSGEQDMFIQRFLAGGGRA
jgi:hypothetical protein